MSHNYNSHYKRNIKCQNSKQQSKEFEIIIISDNEKITEYLYEILSISFTKEE
ncbi:28333_t:CDS:1, partial [Racocetra persica]